jgi:putative acetyltransferase
MIKLLRTNSENQNFVDLVRFLDEDLAIRDGEDHAFYSRFNKIDNIKYVVLAYEYENPVGCGAIKEYSADTAEIKRMYVSPDNRRKGIATRILAELELWAGELSYTRCILETGKRQQEAIVLYQSSGYTSVPNYGQYSGVENSLCFEKKLI